MFISKVKKRYIVGVIVIVFLLWQCSGSDEEDLQAQAQQQRGADAAAQLANQEASAAGQPMPYVQAPPVQPVVVQQPQHDHFWDYVMLHHLFNNNSQPQVVYHRQYVPRSRVNNVTNVTNVTNVKHTAPAPSPAPARTWTQPSTTSRSYTVSAPAKSTMKTRTWSTSSSKGWGSSTSYKPKSSSYSYRSSSSSFRSSSFRGGRR